MNRISRYPFHLPRRAHHAPLLELTPPASQIVPLRDICALAAVLTAAAVLYGLLIWLSLDLVEPAAIYID